LTGKKYSYLSDIWSIGLCVAQSIHPQFPLFINYDDSTMLIQKYILKATKPIHHFFPKLIHQDVVNDFMDKCLHKEESSRLNAKRLLQHPFIVKYLDVKDIDFKSYLLNSNMDTLKRERYKIELISMKQSLNELFLKNKITKNEMQIPIDLIQGHC